MGYMTLLEIDHDRLPAHDDAEALAQWARQVRAALAKLGDAALPEGVVHRHTRTSDEPDPLPAPAEADDAGE